MKILLTGYSGFTGLHFQRHVPCVPLAEADGGMIDLLDRPRLDRWIADMRPEAVVHLAAQTFVPDSFNDPHATFELNVMGTLNLLTALDASGFRGRLLFISSAEVYGTVLPEDLPIKETNPIRPRNPYAASKAAAEALVYQYSQTSNFETIIARPFNQLGSGQRESFVISDFAKQTTEIGLGRRPGNLEVGDIDVTRDFTDVRDTVRAYVLLLKHGKNGEAYNVCSGTEHTIRAMLELLLTTSGVDAEIVQEPKRFRTHEQKRMAGSYEKLRAVSGWQPEISIERTIADVLSDWEQRLARE